jgi:hypothetical protein
MVATSSSAGMKFGSIASARSAEASAPAVSCAAWSRCASSNRSWALGAS